MKYDINSQRPVITIEYQRRYKAARDKAMQFISGVEVLRMWEKTTTQPGTWDFSEERLNRFESAVAVLGDL